jgi:phospho-N-acetylmuramoyl-pentapeptide-transferase
MNWPLLALAGMLGSLLCTWGFVLVMRSSGSGQPIREFGPKIHEHKRGTPTMGGAVILFVFLVLVIASYSLGWHSFSTEAVLLVLATLGFGLIGFFDDMLKVSQQHSKGLLVRYKLIFQILLSAGFIAIFFSLPSTDSSLMVPILNQEISIGMPLLGVLIMFTLLGMVNAMNLTDGLDGLASGVSLIVLAAFGVILAVTGLYGDLLGVVILFGTILLGFFVFNVHPARIFLGDTGSMAMGGFIAALSILTKTELLLALFAFVPVIEALSIFVQLTTFKLFKTRIFKVSPIHHHFERAEGIDYEFLLPNIEWPETRITAVFWGVSAAIASLGIFSYFSI